MLGLGCTSDDEISSRGHAVHLCLHHAHVLPTVLQLDVPDHQIPRGTLGEHTALISANTPPQSLMFSLQREKKSTKNVKLFKNHVVGQQVTAHLQLHASCLGVFSQTNMRWCPFFGRNELQHGELILRRHVLPRTPSNPSAHLSQSPRKMCFQWPLPIWFLDIIHGVFI